MKPSLILAIVALLLFAWMFRYEVIMGRGPIVKLDRWTGALYVLEPEVGWQRFDARPEYEAIEVPAKPAEK